MSILFSKIQQCAFSVMLKETKPSIIRAIKKIRSSCKQTMVNTVTHTLLTYAYVTQYAF
jgi:hypothetical protein